MLDGATNTQHQDLRFSPVQRTADRDSGYALLMASACGGSNSHFLATILAHWRYGLTELPARLGLSKESYQALFDCHFPGLEWPEDPNGMGETEFERLPERDDLIKLMMDNRAGDDPTEQWLAEIVATACMGFDHLWQDMGLWSRNELSELLKRNFPTLAEGNTQNMKWKKFLYKQLCEQQGIYVCRAPSCDECSDYSLCFESEE